MTCHGMLLSCAVRCANYLCQEKDRRRFQVEHRLSQTVIDTWHHTFCLAKFNVLNLVNSEIYAQHLTALINQNKWTQQLKKE